MLFLTLVSVLALALSPTLSQAQGTVVYQEIHDGDYVESSINPSSGSLYDYYKIYLPKPQATAPISELRVSLTSDVGDAELYMINDVYPNVSQPPSDTSFVWRAPDSGKTSLFVTENDQFACFNCYYYIAVYGHNLSASYRLRATIYGNQSHVPLFNHYPHNEVIPAGGSAKYVYLPSTFESNHGIRVVASMAWGLGDLFVNVIDNATFANGTIPQEAFPTPQSAMWSGDFNFATSYLHIHHDDPQYKSSCANASEGYTGCIYLISFFAYPDLNNSAQYTILLTQNGFDNIQNPQTDPDQHTRLTSHVPFIRTLPTNESEFFNATLPLEAGEEFYITVTMLSGLVTLYVSIDGNVLYPNMSSPVSNKIWNSDDHGSHTWSFVNDGTLSSQQVFIGVTAWTNATYMISSGMNPASRPGRYPQRLLDGVPQHDSLLDNAMETVTTLNSWRYYVYYLHFDDGLNIAVNKIMGDVEAYIGFQAWDHYGNYSYVRINSTNYDYKLNSHGLMSLQIPVALSGRYIVGIFAESHADYELTVTPTYTSRFLVESFPSTGHIVPVLADNQVWNNQSNFIFFVDNLDATFMTEMTVIVTTMSGHVRVFVSDSSPFIDPQDSTTYNWTQAGHDTRISEIVIPFSQLRRGSYWACVVASQQSTFQFLYNYVDVRRIQAGLPQDSWIRANESQWYVVKVPGGTENQHDWFLSLVPLVGRAHMFGATQPASGMIWPDHNNQTSFDLVAAQHSTAVQHLYIPNCGTNARANRCFYLVEVWAPWDDTRYNLVLYPYNATGANNAVSVIQHTVPQFGFSEEAPFEGPPSISFYQFFVPENNSVVFFALTVQDSAWEFPQYGRLSYAISQFDYPVLPQTAEWTAEVWDSPATVILPDDSHFSLGRNQSGVYYVSVFNYGTPVQYTVSTAVIDSQSFWTNDSSIMLVNNVRQAGFAPFSFNPNNQTYHQFFRYYQNSTDEQMHLSMGSDMLTYHSTSDPYPCPNRTYESSKNSQFDDVWIEYPSVTGMHFVGATAIGGNVFLHPRIYRGVNDTSLINRVIFGETYQERVLPGNTIHYEFFLPYNSSDMSYIEIQMEMLQGNPEMYINFVSWSSDNNGTYPSNSSNMWNITNRNVPGTWIYPAMAGRYIMAVQAQSNTQAEFRVSAIRHTVNLNNQTDYLQLRSSEPREQFLMHNQSQTYWIKVNDRVESYSELRISITDWLGDAEFFVMNSMGQGSFWAPNYDNFTWRGYDSGTASLVINSSDPNWCNNCVYFITIFADEISSFYSIVAQLHGNYSEIELVDKIPMNAITPVNSQSRFLYRPLNYQLSHGFRVTASPSYGAALFLVNVADITTIDQFNYPWPTMDNYTWMSYGYFEGTGLHISHVDLNRCNARSMGDDNDKSHCVYFITVIETTGFVNTQYTLLVSSSVTADVLTPDVEPYNHLRDPHIRLVNHVPIQQFAEATNMSYYKTSTLNNDTVITISLTVLSGWADIYISHEHRYPNATLGFFSSRDANTTSWSMVLNGLNAQFNFSELFIAVETHINTTYTILVSQYWGQRLGRFPIRLMNGMPQFDSIGGNVSDWNSTQLIQLQEWRYFVFYLPVADSISLSVQKFLGEVDLYFTWDPLSTNGNNSYSQYQIPDQSNYDEKIDNHALMAYTWNYAPPGRYVIGVKGRVPMLSDYQISFTAGFTHNVLTRNFPTVGYVRVNMSDNAPYTVNTTRYKIIVPDVQNDHGMTISVTQLSGHVHVYVSDITPFIDPTNSSTYRWSSTGTRLDMIHIHASELRQGPYWISIVGFQDSTYQILATDHVFTGVQLGLPIAMYLNESRSAVFALTLPGGPTWEFAHAAFFSVMPWFGHAYIAGTNITTEFSYPNVSAGVWDYDLIAHDRWYKPQTVFIRSDEFKHCWQPRCTYLFEVFAVVDTAFTVTAYPWASVEMSNTTIMLAHTVPQLGFTGHHMGFPHGNHTHGPPRPSNMTRDPSSLTHYSFHIPDENSTATLAFTLNAPPFMLDPMDMELNGFACVSRFHYATHDEECDRDLDWFIPLAEMPVLRIDPYDRVLRHLAVNFSMGMAGHYYVTVRNVDFRPLTYTVTFAVKDEISKYTNDSSVVMVSGLYQSGFEPRPFFPPFNGSSQFPNASFPFWPNATGFHAPYSWYRMYHQNDTHQIHVKMLAPGAMDLYHSTVLPYPQFNDSSDLVDMKSSAIDIEWYEWPLQNTTHYFGAIAEPGPFTLFPYILDCPNATNYREPLQWGEPREGRLQSGHTMYFNFLVFDFDIEMGLEYVDVLLSQYEGTSHAYITYAPFNTNTTYKYFGFSNVTYPSASNNMWNISNRVFPETGIYPVLAGEYLIAVTVPETAGESTFLLSIAAGANRTESPVELYNNVPTGIQFIPANGTKFFFISVPVIHDRFSHNELRIALTSYAGNAEFFVSRNVSELVNWEWEARTFDSGTTSMIIPAEDERFCWDSCDYWIRVYGDDINGAFSIVASFDEPFITSYIRLQNHMPMNYITSGMIRFPPGPPNQTVSAPHPPPGPFQPEPGFSRFTFRPLNYQLRHGIRVHTTPAYGSTMMAVNAVNASSVMEDNFPWPSRHSNSTWIGQGFTQGDWVHIKPSDPGFCSAYSWGQDLDESDCIYLITVFGPDYTDQVEYTIHVSTTTVDAELNKTIPVADDAYAPHIRLVNNIPLNQFQYNGTVEYYRFFTDTAGVENVITLTSLSGFAFFAVSADNAYPSYENSEWNSFDANTTTLQFVHESNAWGREVYVAVWGLGNVTYTMLLSQYPSTRLGRYPIRLVDGMPQFDTLGELNISRNGDAPAALSHWRYYVFYLPEDDDSITVSVQKFMGEVDVYMLVDRFRRRTDSRHDWPGDYNVPSELLFNHSMADHGLNAYSRVGDQHDITIRTGVRRGRYAFAVHAHYLADYSISVTAANSPNVLQKDTPTAGYIKPYPVVDMNGTALYTANYSWYVLDMVNVWERDLVITVTEFSGHVDVYVFTFQPNFTDPHHFLTLMGMANYSNTDEQIIIPRDVLAINQFWIFVVAADDSTFQILATDYYLASLQLGLPQSAWIQGGDSHVYAIVVPGGEQRHDIFVSGIPLIGRVGLFATNCTTSFTYPNFTNGVYDYSSYQDRYDAVNTVALPGWTENCTAKRCFYLIEVFCFMNHTGWCRYDLNAFSWNTSDYSNTTIVMKQNVPQPSFTSANFGSSAGFTHFVFHVQLEHSNCSLFFTSLANAGYNLGMGVSRWGFPTDILGSDSEFHSGTRNGTTDGFPAVYFDWTDSLFAQKADNGRMQSGVWYATIWSEYIDEMYTVTFNQVNDYTRGTNRSAIILVDGLPQVVVLGRRQPHLLYAFVVPQQSADRPYHGVSFIVDGEADAMSDLYVTWDGSVPSPTNYQAVRFAEDVDTGIFLLPGFGQGGCDNHVRDCFYQVTAQNHFNSVPNVFQLIASRSAFQVLESGVERFGYAGNVSGTQNYTFYLQEQIADYRADISISIQPVNTFCSVMASIELGAYPNETSIHTEYIAGVRTLRVFNATVGEYIIAVQSFDLSGCAYRLVLNVGVITLEEGMPYGDVLPPGQFNDSWAWYRYNAETFQDKVIVQVDSLTDDSGLNLYITPGNCSSSTDCDFNMDPTTWPYQSVWNQTYASTNSLIIASTPDRPITGGYYYIAVHCDRRGGLCGYEVVAQLGSSSRYLQDGITVKEPEQLAQDQMVFYRTAVRPDPAWSKGWTLTIGRLTGQVKVFISTVSRRPDASNFNKSAEMKEFDNYVRIGLSLDELQNNPGGYVFIGVYATSPNTSYTIVSSLSAIFLMGGVEEVGTCSETEDQIFLFNLDTVAYRPVTFSITSMDPSFNGTRQLATAVMDARWESSTHKIWNFNLGYDMSYPITALDPDLFNCTQNWRGCVLLINVSRCAVPQYDKTTFMFLVQAGNSPAQLPENEARPVLLYHNSNLGPSQPDFELFEVPISQSNKVEIYLDDCIGTNFLYINYPSTIGYPTSSTNDQALIARGHRQTFIAPLKQLQPGESFRINIQSQTDGWNKAEVFVNVGYNITAVAFVREVMSGQMTETSATLSFNYLVNAPVDDQLLYSFWYSSYPLNAVLATRCGVHEQDLVQQYGKTLTLAEMQSLADDNGNVVFTIDGLNPGTPYVFGLLVESQNTHTYDAMVPFSASTSSKSGGDKADTGAIVLGVLLPIAIILAALAVFFYVRNKRLRQELSVELPDVSATPSSAAARRRAQRAGESGSDSFSRGGGDMYSNLLGDDETAEDANKRRRGKKSKARTSEEAVDESSVPYRSDVI